MHNVADRQPEIVSRLKSKLAAIRLRGTS
jgi:hypothetical protein